MDNPKTIAYKKAGLTPCLFLLVLYGFAQPPPEWFSKPELQSAYHKALNLQLSEARKTVTNYTDPESVYIASLCDALELLVTEDNSKFDSYQDAWEKRLQALNRQHPKTADILFASAELRLQRAFVYLKFGHEFDAAWNIRQSYLLAQECMRKFPRFTRIKKTSGLLNVMLGSVPEKYQWILSVLAMQGSVDKGVQELTKVKAEDSPLSAEATLLLYLVQGLILQQTQAAMDGLDHLPDNMKTQLALFLSAIVAIKNSESEKALQYLHKIQSNPKEIAIPYLSYLTGEVLLHKGEYSKAIESYQNFLLAYAGENFVKDAHYKTAICYWLLGDVISADRYMTLARSAGTENAEADRYAARSVSDKSYPHPVLTKIRYATDGGYYSIALQLINTADQSQFRTPKEQTEFSYRKARLFHKTNQLNECKKYYIETIKLSGENPWYFAPNACLQLGYLYKDEGNDRQAAYYFRKALSYKKHEYKNSIDSKSKSALEQLKKVD